MKQPTGISISSLDPGTVLIVETTLSFYRIKIIEGKEVMITGGMTKSGEDRFPVPTEAIIYGSTRNDAIMIDWIGKDMKMEVIFGDSMDQKLITSKVIDLTVEAGDASWSYSMDWSKK